MTNFSTPLKTHIVVRNVFYVFGPVLRSKCFFVCFCFVLFCLLTISLFNHVFINGKRHFSRTWQS